MMKSIYILLLFVACQSFAFNSSFEKQNLFLELQHISDNNWGVYVVHENTVNSDDLLHAGSGQITLVAPAGFTYFDFQNYGGTWVENARVTNPVEAKSKCYVSFGFVTDSPKINLQINEKTLLFTFRTDDNYFGDFYLFENGIDPFEAPNSYGTNPGNDLGIIARTIDNDFHHYLYQGNISYPTLNIYSESVKEMGDEKTRVIMVSEKE